MKQKLNPLTLLFLMVAYIFSLFSVVSWSGYIWHLAVIIFVIYLLDISFHAIKQRVRPVIVFIPFMTILYCIFSFSLSTDPVTTVFQQALDAATKILLLVMVTSMFLEIVSSSRIMDALRTLWYRQNLRWRVVEDLFQLIDLSLRFFPLVASEVKALASLDKTLGFVSPKSKVAKIKKAANHLPTLIITCIHRASQIGRAMDGRGYGTVLPRTIAKPISFDLIDWLVMIVVIIFFVGRTFFA